MLRKVAIGLVGLGMIISGSAMAASDVSNSAGTQNQATAAVAVPVVAGQTTGIIINAITPNFIPANAAPVTLSGFNSRDTGRNAGAGDKKYGLWLQGAYSNIEDSTVGAGVDGDAFSGVLGLDYKLNDRMMLGVAFTYENVDLDTSTLAGAGKSESDGFGIAPYIGFSLSPQWSASATAGYSWVDYDTSRNGNTITGSFDAKRWFASGALNGSYARGNLRIMPQVGILYLNEDQDAYTESTGAAVGSTEIKLGRLSAGGRLGYVTGSVMPYVKLIGEYDFEHPDAVAIGNGTFTSDDDFGGKVGVGMDFFTARSFTGTVETSYDSLGRSELDVWTLMARLRTQF